MFEHSHWPHLHTNTGGWQAATSDERHRRLGGPAARPGGRVREPRDSPRRPAALAPRASRRREGGEVRARANWIFELHGRRSPRDGRLAPAVRRHARARTRSECDGPLRRGHRRWPRGSCLAAGGEAARGAQSAPGGRFTRWLLAGRAPPATGSVFGMNSRAMRRAGELAAADPAHRVRLGRRLELAARSRPEILPCGAPFAHELERGPLSAGSL